MQISRDKFQQAIEKGIAAAQLDGDVAERLRYVGRTAKRAAVGDFFIEDCLCPASQAFPSPTRVARFPGALKFAMTFDREFPIDQGIVEVERLTAEQKAAREAWATALETTKRGQCQRRLGDEGKRCCLGVLGDLAVVHGVIEYDDLDYNDGVPPRPVLEWVGMTHFEENTGDLNAAVTYATMNDTKGMSFKQIAQKVRESA